MLVFQHIPSKASPSMSSRLIRTSTDGGTGTKKLETKTSVQAKRTLETALKVAQRTSEKIEK